jgi:hypothetical protein
VKDVFLEAGGSFGNTLARASDAASRGDNWQKVAGT